MAGLKGPFPSSVQMVVKKPWPPEKNILSLPLGDDTIFMESDEAKQKNTTQQLGKGANLLHKRARKMQVI